jgi:hypothetical protein
MADKNSKNHRHYNILFDGKEEKPTVKKDALPKVKKVKKVMKDKIPYGLKDIVKLDADIV